MTTKLERIEARAALAHTELQWEQSAGSVCDEFFDGDMPLLLAVAAAAAAAVPSLEWEITHVGVAEWAEALLAAIAPLLEEAD